MLLLEHHNCCLGHRAELACGTAVAGWGEKQPRGVLAREVTQVAQQSSRCGGEEGGFMLVGLFLAASPWGY